MNEMAQIGVFVCGCGDKISGGLDLSDLVAQVGELAQVAWVGQSGYWCSPAGLEQLRETFVRENLDRVVIAGCTPRTHDALFARALDGLINPGLIAISNLRDLCVRPHRTDPAGVSAKARDQIAMTVADLAGRQAAVPRTASITPHVVVIGGGMAGLTAALSVADTGIAVTLVERGEELGGGARQTLSPSSLRFPSGVFDLNGKGKGDRSDLLDRIAALRDRDTIQIRTGAQVIGVSGAAGDYRLALSDGEVIQAGAIIVATGAHAAAPQLPPPASCAQNVIFTLCDISPEQAHTCTHTCCLTAVRQASEYRRQVPEAQVAILFRELYTAGGAYDELYWEAQQAGVRFVRYPSGSFPQAIGGKITTFDELAGDVVSIPCDRVIPFSRVVPDPDAARLAAMLRLQVDTNGFIPDVRFRLRPANYIERGIYVCGAAHFPCDADRAVFQAYSAAARAIQHIRRREITNWSPAAEIDASRCNGCGDCTRVCPFSAATVIESSKDCASAPQDQIERKLAEIDSLLCTGCGNCVSVCPVGAAQILSATDGQVEAQVRAALSGDGAAPRVLLFACEWSGYAAAEMAGAQERAYPACTRLVRVNCTGRLQPGLLLRALEMGAAGVLILGCEPGACHYEQGNERAANAFEQTKALGRLMGLDRRLGLKWIPADDGAAFVGAVGVFVKGLERTHPVAGSEH